MFKKMTMTQKRGLWKEFYKDQITRHWKIYALGILAVLTTNITELMVPKFSQWAVDHISGKNESLPSIFHGSFDPLAVIGALLAVNLFVGVLSRMGWRQFLGKRTHYAARKIRRHLWRSISEQKLEIFSRYPSGDLINRSITDINPARFIFGFTVVFSCDLLFFGLIGMTMMFAIDTVIASAVMGVFFCLPFLIFNVVKKEYDLHDMAQAKLSLLSESITQMLTSVRLQRVTGMTKPWLDRLERESQDYSADQFQLEKINSYIFPLSNLAIISAYACILFLGLNRLNQGLLTPGEFVALMSLVLMIKGPLVDIAFNILEWQQGISSLDRICEIIALEGELQGHKASATSAELNGPDISDSSDSSELREHSLITKDLSFSYNPAREPGQKNVKNILSNISLSLSTGESLGIMGKVGAGKTTLVNLVAGISTSAEGAVFIDGRDVTKMSRYDITQKISIVSQKPFLFAGSVRENLCLDHFFDEQTLWDVLDDVGLKDYFEGFEQKLDTLIGEWGISLSGGQKQRLALARNLLRPKPIMIFDDCLSAVDTKTEAHVQQAIRKKASKSILIWIAHRKSTVAGCDRIASLESGRLSYHV